MDSSIRAQKLLEDQIRAANATGDFGLSAGRYYRNIPPSLENPSGRDYSRAEELNIDYPLRAEISTLLQGRPWSELLLNEGSFIKAYATYEWWLRLPPSVSKHDHRCASFANNMSDSLRSCWCRV
jgi:hypothetical protein